MWRARLAYWWAETGRRHSTLLACFLPLPITFAAVLLLPPATAVLVVGAVWVIAIAWLLSKPRS